MDGVLFDLDDTLVDQASAAASAVVAWVGDDRPGLVARWTEVSALHYRRFQDRELTYEEHGLAERQQLKADRAGITAVVDVLVASSTLPASKPHPSAFHSACEQLGTAPGRTLMVGDSLADDVAGATAAGLPAVLLDRHDAHPGAGVRRVRSLDELELVAH